MSLTPTTHFEAWGQALYLLPPMANAYADNDYQLIFAVADANHEWLAWYLFSTSSARDRVLLHDPLEVVAEGSVRQSRFTTHPPILSEELCGFVQASRGPPSEPV
jgi:hypothetical protein